MGVLAINGESLCARRAFRWPYATESDANVLEEVKRAATMEVLAFSQGLFQKDLLH